MYLVWSRKRDFANLEAFGDAVVHATPEKKFPRLSLQCLSPGNSAESALDASGLSYANFKLRPEPAGRSPSDTVCKHAQAHPPQLSPLHAVSTSPEEPVLTLAPPSPPARPAVVEACSYEACTGCEPRLAPGNGHLELRDVGRHCSIGEFLPGGPSAQAKAVQRLEGLVVSLARSLASTRSQLTTAVQLALHLSQQLDKGATLLSRRHDAETIVDCEESEGSVEVLPGGVDTADAESIAQDIALVADGDADADGECDVSSVHVCRMCESDLACAVVLPCRHLVLCERCSPSARTCPDCCGHIQSVLYLAE